jgi:hypothetical protein
MVLRVVTRQVVLLSGLLKKPGVIANCLVRAEKVTTSQQQVWGYVRIIIECAPHLPDGDYELQFESRKIMVLKQGEHWTSALK